MFKNHPCTQEYNVSWIVWQTEAGFYLVVDEKQSQYLDSNILVL